MIHAVIEENKVVRSPLFHSPKPTEWVGLAEIYTMHSFAPFWNRIPKTRKTMGRKEPGPYNPGKTWPGEAHKQPQLATQYYPCAIDEECLRIRNKVLTGDFQWNSR